MSLSGKVIAITGAASGIGLALSHLLATEGSILSIADISQEPLDALAKTLAQKGTKILATQLDVCSNAAVEDWISSTVKAFGRLDGAVNLAGIFRRSGSLMESSNEEFESMMSVNFFGVLNCMRAEIKAMKLNDGNGKIGKVGGSVINAASTAGFQGVAGHASYVASKHAVIGLTKTAAREVGPLGIRVNAICPSVVETPMISTYEEEHGMKFQADRVALRRNATADDVANVIRFLLSEDSGFVNGHTQVVDGGSNAGHG